jgi:hypothetical protein
MKTFMKVLCWLGWISAAIGALLIILGLISLLVSGPFLGVPHAMSFFQAANSFLLMAIFLYIATKNRE